MKVNANILLLFLPLSLLTTGCSGRTTSETSAARLPWSRVKEVEVTGDTEAQQSSSQALPKANGAIGPGSSQSEVVMAWGMPDYIYDSAADQNRKIWQYSHALVVFQGTKVEKVFPR